MTDLAGASIIVLGATGGLGREFAHQLSAAGARLTLTGRSMLALDDLGIDGAALIPADLTDAGEAEKVVAAAKHAHGRVDGVIVASGAVAFGPLVDTSDETLEALWAINVLAPMRVLRAAAPALAESAAAGGSPFVVSISGVVAETPTAGIGAYSAVKSAQAAAHQVAARELRRAGIRVLDARPGHTETELSKHPLAGERPAFPVGYAPAAVVTRILDAVRADEKDLPSSAFQGLPTAQAV
ncbi:SDR family NAD(P)-dependent oxidoreductase [Microcella sp.]|uniref:SDR family NAD(P)-dependent oxidoreductase n=1 Tax=Microcella sp. TaxID=1913979 RepID=UPI003919C72A